MLLELDILDASEKDAVNNPDLSTEKSKKSLWRSFAHLEESPDYKNFVKGEFMPTAVTNEKPNAHSRRSFVQIMGASMAMMGLAACRKPFEKVLPYTRQPEEIIPGKPQYFATAMPFQGIVHPVIVESHEGRPTKIEGNTDHPYKKGVGSTGLYEQASILNMFDPDRLKVPMKGADKTSWSKFLDVCAQVQGKRVAVIAPSNSSPTLQALKATFATKFPQGRWVTFDAAGDDYAALGAQMALGRPLRAQYDFSKAKVIVSLDSDFLAPSDRNMAHNNREYAASRRVMSTGDDMSRLYVIESAFTNTGSMADNRLKMRSADVPFFAAALAAKLGIAEGASKAKGDAKWVDAIAADLQKNAGKSVVLAGENQPTVVHALCALINQKLGNIGTTVKMLDTGDAALTPQIDQMKALVGDMNAGNVDMLLMLGVNPVYSAAADLGFEGAMKKVANSVYAGYWLDETAQKATWTLPLSHYLEAWGDGRSFDGTLSVIQPLIAPLYSSKSDVEVINMLVNANEASGYDLVKAQWANVAAGKAWDKVLHDGFVAGTAYPEATGAANGAAVGAALAGLREVAADSVEVVFRASHTVYDGTFTNNAWMLELPDPITKVVWENVAIMSPKTAEKLGVSLKLVNANYVSDRINLKLNDRTIDIPVWEVPGYADNSIGLNLGWGRDLKLTDREAWESGFFDRDVNVYQWGAIGNGKGSAVEKLRTSTAMQVGTSPEVSVKEGGYQVVSTQDHGALDWDNKGGIVEQQRRQIVRMATLDEYKKDPHFAPEKIEKLEGAKEDWMEYPALWEDKAGSGGAANDPETQKSLYYKYQWAMNIDLNACTGCSACVTACQSENNIQVVGKDVVAMGRETSWMRIDRYFYGSETDPGMVVQPMLCHHCENAPCEQVCPVNATSHSPDGINEMTYNRCVGTRYCANNCPYKVRRFNYFNWTRDLPNSVRMAQNPDVTVRYRGVMEKCSFCVQRVREAGIDARQENRDIREGEVVTACQQACPAQAITFGNIRDSKSQIVKMRQNDRNYYLFAELAIRPRLSYLARLRNPNTALVTPQYGLAEEHTTKKKEEKHS
jgi:molybdopterin-containing oxidoreductase family iron-sulfur binding subunit